MDNFDPYNVLLAIATNIPVLLMTAFVLQGHILHSVSLQYFNYFAYLYSGFQTSETIFFKLVLKTVIIFIFFHVIF